MNFWSSLPDLAGGSHQNREDKVHTVTSQVAASSSRPPTVPPSSLARNTMADNTSGQPDRSVQVKLVLLGTSSRIGFLGQAPHTSVLTFCEPIFQARPLLANLPSYCVSCVSFRAPNRSFCPLTRSHTLQVSNEFQPNKEPTIGAAFLTQKCRLEDRVLRYEIWDTAGQERFHSLAVRPHPNPRIFSPHEVGLTRLVPITSDD